MSVPESTLDRITLVYRDLTGAEHTQPLRDITEVGTLIDPDDGSDMELVDARVRPAEHPIVLGAESLRAELDEAPDVHDLTPAQAERIAARWTDEEIDAAIRAEADDDFWAQYDAVRARAISRLATDPLVCIVHLDGDDYEQAVDAANDQGGSVDAVAGYLAQWDYGRENDDASFVNGRTELADLENLPHQLHETEHGGLHYWLQIDHGLRFYALYRRPLDQKG